MIRFPAGYDSINRIKRYQDYYQASYGVMLLSAGQFSPLSLFAAGEQGAWYDPSDFSTMFQDSAGTTPVTAVEQPVGLIRDKSGRGNHASQSTAASRPVLSARVNQLTFSEQFDNAAWTKQGINAFGSGSVVNTTDTTDPLGTNTADFLQENTFNSVKGAYIGSGFPAGSYKISCAAKAAGRNFVVVRIPQNGGGTEFAYATFNLTTGAVSKDATIVSVASAITAASANISPLGNGWHRLELSVTSTSAFAYGPSFDLCDTGTPTPGASSFGATPYTGNGTSGIYIWGADLRVTNVGVNLPAYQRVAAATDYDTSGFPMYLRSDGVDDRLIGPAISNIISVSAYEACIGARVISVSTDSASPWANQTLVADDSGYVGMGYARTSNVIGAYNYDTGIDTSTVSMTPPSTFVLQQRHDAGNLVLSLNGGAEASAASGDTAGVTGNLRLFSALSSVSIPAHLYGVVIRSTAFTAAERANVLTYVNNLTKAY